MKLRQRLFVWNTGVIFAVGGVLLLAIYLIVAHKVKKEFFQFLTDEYGEGILIVRKEADNPAGLARAARAARTEVEGARYFPMIFRVYDARREENLIAVATREEWLEALPQVHSALQKPVHTRTLTEGPTRTERLIRDFNLEWEHNRAHYSVSNAPIEPEELHFLTGSPDPENHPDLAVQVGLSYERVHLRLESLRSYLLGGFALMVLLSAAGGYVLTDRGLQPLRRLSESIERVTASNISRRLPEPRPEDEVARITRSVNGMLGRIERALQQMKDFTADAAHELRTPLSAARCRLEVALEDEDLADKHRGAIREALDQLSGLNGLINNLLLLANLDARPDSYERTEVDLSELLRHVGEFFEVAAGEKEVAFRMDCPEDLKVRGNRELLRRLFSNLLQNAVRHVREGGHIGVRARAGDATCRVEVTNTGPAIPQEQLMRIFHRFHKADVARERREEGYGLGLSICQKIAEVHGGLIRAESNEEEGTTIRVHLPLAHDM